MKYVLLVDVGCDWPDVVRIGSHEECTIVADELAERGVTTSVQAVVTVDEALIYAEENEREGPFDEAERRAETMRLI